MPHIGQGGFRQLGWQCVLNYFMPSNQVEDEDDLESGDAADEDDLDDDDAREDDM